MKKSLLIIGVAIFSLFQAKAQFIEIMRANGNHSINDSTITVVGNNGMPQYTVNFYVVNTGISTLNVKCKWEIKTAVAHTSNAICWGLCFGANSSLDYTAPSTQAMSKQGGGTDTNITFVGYYNDSSKVATESIYYIFYNSTNPSDSSWVLVNYVINSDAGVANVSANQLHISAPYPNPANKYASFNYNINTTSHLTLYNSIGQKVNDAVLNPSGNRFNLDVSGMPSGIYFCELYDGTSQPVFQKLVVAH